MFRINCCRHLDERQWWKDLEFVNECMRAVIKKVQKKRFVQVDNRWFLIQPQHSQLVTTELLGHLDQIVSVPTKTNAVKALTSFFESIIKVVYGPLVELLIPLVTHLCNTINVQPIPFSTVSSACKLTKKIFPARKNKKKKMYPKMSTTYKHPSSNVSASSADAPPTSPANMKWLATLWSESVIMKSEVPFTASQSC